MNARKIFLGFSALAWLPYGLFLAVTPTYLYEIAGLAANTPTALTEVRAMYGGLQAAIGALALYALFKPQQAQGTLTALAFIFTGLASVRIIGALLDGEVGGYTGMALVFEIFCSVCAWLLLSQKSPTGATAARA